MRGHDAPGETRLFGEKAAFLVEVVSDPSSMEKGLSGRESMPDDRAMLFLLDSAEEKYFWMKGMRFPLDMVIFDRDRKVLDIIHKLQPCESCSLIRIPPGAAYLLEIKAGLSEKHGIKKGDYFELR